MSARKDFATLVVTFTLNGGLNHITLRLRCLFVYSAALCMSCRSDGHFFCKASS